MKPILLFVTLYTLTILSGCGSDPITDNWPVDVLYQEAKDALDVGDYETAIKYYEILEARYPFGKYAQQAQLDIIYGYYKYEEPESALVAADRFIKLYPRHSNVDYVYYLKGLINFELDQGMLDRFLPLDHSQRDPTASKRAFQEFSELLRRFPNSRYSQDARQRMIHLRNRLAKHELHVAKFYMKRSAYLAAANRAKTVVQAYPRTPAVPEALVIMAKAYKIMALNDLSDNALKVLTLNYPNHKGIAEVNNLVVK